MASWLKYKVKQPVSDRQPDDKSLLPWSQREVHPFLQQVRRVLNWAVDWLGKVGVDSTDTPGLLADKLVVDPATMEATVEGEDGNRTLKLSAKIPDIPPPTEIPTLGDIPDPWPGPMTMVGQDFAGDTGMWADGNHSHPIPPQNDPDPTTTATRLYPAKIVDPLNRGFFTCCYLGPHFAGGNTPMLVGWNYLGGGVYEYPTTGAIPKDWLDGVDVQIYGADGYSTMVGKTVLAYFEGATSLLGDEEKLQQLFVIEDTGDHMEPVEFHPETMTLVSTKARLRRVPSYSVSSQWVHGMTFQCQAGTRYGTDFFTLDNTSVTLGTTAIEWVHTEGPTFTWADSYELLTGPQLTSEGASRTTETWTLTMASGDADATAVETLLGTPGVATLPAAAWLFDVEAIWLDSVPSGTTTTLRVEVRADNGVTAPVLFTAESLPITNTVAASLSFAYDDAGHTISTTDRLVAIYRLHTDSTDPVTLHIHYNSAARGTRITVPFSMAISGAADGDHNHLSNRDQDVGLGEDACHPADAVGPGFLHTPVATSTITAGLLPSPTRNDIIATLASGTELKWIGTTKMSAGDKVLVRFVDPLILRHGDGSPPASSAPLWLNGSDMDDRDVNWLEIPFGNCVALFQLCTDGDITPSPCWRMLWNRTGELLT